MSADPPPLPASFPLPAVHTELSRHIAPPPTTHFTRTLLATHLAALAAQPRITAAVGTPDEFSRFLDLELGRTSGVRRAHLTAHRDLAIARKEHAAARAALNAELATSEEDEEEADQDPAWMRPYMDVHRIRRKLERLAILRGGLSMLAEMKGVGGKLAAAYPHRGPEVPDEVAAGGAREEGAGDGGAEEALVLELEKRIVGAAERVRVDAAMVEELRGLAGEGDRARGLRAVNDALVGWCHHMMEFGEEEAVGESPGRRRDSFMVAPAKKSVDQMMAEIDEAYTAYLAARRDLLSILASREANPVPLAADDAARAEEARVLMAHRLDVAPPKPAPQVLRVLAAAEHLLPLARTQKALLAAQNHHSTSIARKRAAFSDKFSDGGGVAAGEDPVEVARRRGGEVVQVVDAAEKEARVCVKAAKGSFEEIGVVAEEVEELCEGAGRKREKAKKAIPVKAGKVEVEPERGIWGKLGGGVGVIGDGI